MTSGRVCAALLAVVLLVAGCAGPAPSGVPGSLTPSPSSPGPLRVMPLGDSITGSPGCWRAILWTRLQASGRTGVDFVGSRGKQDCPHAYPPLYGPHDGDNEGHGGFLMTEVAAGTELTGWLTDARPDIILMHFGTNDVWRGISQDKIISGYSTVVDRARAVNPAVKVLVARILPMDPVGCDACAARVTALNNAIPDWAATASTAVSPVVVVDQWTGFDTATATTDGVHPNNAGNRRIADVWFAALSPLVPVTGPPSPTAT